MGSGRLVVDTRILTRSLDTRTGRFPLSTLLWKRPITAAVADAPPAAIRGQAPENQDLRLSPVLVYDLWSGTGDVYIIYICIYARITSRFRYTNHIGTRISITNLAARTTTYVRTARATLGTGTCWQWASCRSHNDMLMENANIIKNCRDSQFQIFLHSIYIPPI